MALKVLTRAKEVLADVEFKHDPLDQSLRAAAQELGIKAGQMFQPIRVAVCGRKNAPPLFETLEVLGRETTLARIRGDLASWVSPPRLLNLLHPTSPHVNLWLLSFATPTSTSSTSSNESGIEKQKEVRMKAVQISKPGGNFEMVERPVPEPGRGQVRIKVEACGVCHSDTLVKEGHFPGLQYPRVPGHEIAGRIDAVGADVTQWKPGQRVGVGMARRALLSMRPLPPGRFHSLPIRKDHRHPLRRRLCGIHDCARGGGCVDARRPIRRGSCSVDVCRNYRV